MALVLLIAAGLGWVAYRARLQREAVSVIVKAGGKVFYEGQRFDGTESPPPTSGALRRGFARGSWRISRTSTGGPWRWLTFRGPISMMPGSLICVR